MRSRRSKLLFRDIVKMVLWLVFLVSVLSDPSLAQRDNSNLPNPMLTPGDTVEATREVVCGSGDTNTSSKISITLKRQIFDRYRLKPGAIGLNVDHLIPVNLGGSNSPKNLWPQPLSGAWNYHMKNRLERTLKKMVCKNEIELEKAQRELATDWISAYQKYITKKERRERRRRGEGEIED